MKVSALAGRAVGVLLVVVVAALLAGQVFGQPVLLSYVETGSMEPTLEPGDGFVPVPMVLAGEVEPGDVVVFEAERLHGGGLVTHRVVGTTGQGFVTKGDANPVTDQASGSHEPPVRREQIVATALQVGDRPVAIPGFGTAVVGLNRAIGTVQRTLATLFGTRAFLGPQGLVYLLFGGAAVAYAFTAVGQDGQRRRRVRRTRRAVGQLRGTHLVLALTLVVVAVTTASMAVPSGTHRFAVVSAESDAPGVDVIRTGDSELTQYRVPSNGLVPVVVFLEPSGDGIEVGPRELHVGSGQVGSASVTIHAPPQTGYYRRFLVEHRYAAVLPVGVIRALYLRHPWLPILAIDALVGLVFATLGLALVGTGPVRLR